MPPNDRQQRMLAKYRRVTTDRLGMLVPALEELNPDQAPEERITAIKRELHTLKGEARMMKLDHLARLAHGIEELFIGAVEARDYELRRDHLIDGLDLVGKLIDAQDPFLTDTSEVDTYLAEQKPAGRRKLESPAALRVETEARGAGGPARFVAKFKVSSEKRLATIRDALSDLTRAPHDEALQALLQREIHTVKGDARLVKLELVSEVAAAAESWLLHMSAHGGISGVEPRIECGLQLIEELCQLEGEPPAELMARVQEFQALTIGRCGSDGAGVAHSTDGKVPSTPVEAPTGEVLSSFVSVDASHLASLTTVAGELIVRHEQVDRSIADMQRIAQNILQDVGHLARTLEGEHTHTTSGRRREHFPRLHALGRELLSTIARAKDEQFDGRLHLTALQNEIREVRMVRVGELFMRHGRALRDLARELGKRIAVKTEGVDVTVDKHVLDHLDEPLLHLVRNAVDHAFGTPEERRRAGKPERGELKLVAKEAGGHVLIEIVDDGAGIDPTLLRDAAVRRGIISSEEAATLDRTRSLALLFRAGFSTRDTTSEISGRGVGLDVVRAQLAELGGSVSVESELGVGTKFLLRCPISVAFASALVVKAADELYALPSTSVIEVLHVAREELETVGSATAIMYQARRIPLVPLAHLLGLTPKPTAEHLRVVIVQAESLVALQVESVLGEREAVRRSLNQFLSGVSVITGTATVEGRRLVMFLNLSELLGGGARPTNAANAVSVSNGRKQRVLIVDDSELTRDMLVSLLERLGYSVDEAVDGADALHTIKKTMPDLVLTDLDMPVMNGFLLVERLRADQRFEDLPVIVFSTRGSDEDKRRAMEAGANGYLVKSAFHAEELHRTLQRHLAASTHR